MLSCATIAYPLNSAQLRGTPTILQSYIGVRAVVWACGEEQTDTLTHRHIDGRDHYAFRVVYDSREM